LVVVVVVVVAVVEVVGLGIGHLGMEMVVLACLDSLAGSHQDRVEQTHGTSVKKGHY
jgi:hypothetical protein